MLMFATILSSVCAVILTSIHLIIRQVRDQVDSETLHNYDDIDVKREIEQQKKKMREISDLTGNSPIKQIDWIIDNSLNKFHELCTSVMNGTYRDEKEIELVVHNYQMTIDDVEYMLGSSLSSRDYRVYSSANTETTEIRGGIGNKELASWIEHRKNISDLF